MSEQIRIIDTGDLRDHSDRARTDRVWERLERNVVLPTPNSVAKPKRRFPLVAAAIAAGFAGGLFVSETFDETPQPSSPVVVAPADDQGTREVFAAGEQARSYPLPGGGTLHVTPGTIVDTVTRGQNGMTLRLVRGEATLTTPPTAAAGTLALQVGRAEVKTADGSMRVRLDGDTADLEIINGKAVLTTPDENVKHRVIDPSKRKLRVRVTVASNALEPSRVPGPLAVANDTVDSSDEPAEIVDEAPVALAAWVVACNDADFDKAAKLIRQAEGGMDAQLAKAPNYRGCIADGLELSNQDSASIALNEATFRDPAVSDSEKAFAASSLARLYRAKGDSARATEFSMAASQLSKGTLQSESGLCENVKTAFRTGKPADFKNLVTDYRSTYPDGDCTDTIAGLEKELAAKLAAAAAEAKDNAGDEPAKSEEPPKTEEDAYEGDDK